MVQTNCGNFTGQANLVEGSKPKNKEDLIELAKQIQQVLTVLRPILSRLLY